MDMSLELKQSLVRYIIWGSCKTPVVETINKEVTLEKKRSLKIKCQGHEKLVLRR